MVCHVFGKGFIIFIKKTTIDIITHSLNSIFIFIRIQIELEDLKKKKKELEDLKKSALYPSGSRGREHTYPTRCLSTMFVGRGT